MKAMTLPFLGIMTLGLLACSSESKTAFECPDIRLIQTSSGMRLTPAQTQQMSDQLQSEIPHSIAEAVGQLRQQYPKATSDEVVDFMLAAYCPKIAADPALSNSERKAKFDRLSNRLDSVVSAR